MISSVPFQRAAGVRTKGDADSLLIWENRNYSSRPRGADCKAEDNSVGYEDEYADQDIGTGALMMEIEKC